MTEGRGPADGGRGSHFELSPPRNFLFPAVLLLVSESPRHGYALVAELEALHVGSIDRPGVYRALAQLQRDGLIVGEDEEPPGGSPRTVYRSTERGRVTLDEWMRIMAEERDGLDRVVRRHQALHRQQRAR